MTELIKNEADRIEDEEEQIKIYFDNWISNSIIMGGKKAITILTLGLLKKLDNESDNKNYDKLGKFTHLFHNLVTIIRN